MATIKYKQTSITISNDGGFSTLQNAIRYSITAELTDAGQLAELFPKVKFELVNGKLQFASTVQVPTMWEIIKQVEAEQSDVGIKAYDIIIKWSTNLIYQLNLLELETINEWEIK